jgi:hypothetical protein
VQLASILKITALPAWLDCFCTSRIVFLPVLQVSSLRLPLSFANLVPLIVSIAITAVAPYVPLDFSSIKVCATIHALLQLLPACLL